MCVGYPFLLNSQKVNRKLAVAIINRGADIIDLQVSAPDMLSEQSQIIEISKYLLKKKYDKNILVYLLSLVKDIRKRINCPIIITGITNTFLDYGLKEFFMDASESGVDGLHVLDLPPEESKDFFYYAKSYGLELIFMINENTAEERLKNILAASSSIVYLNLNNSDLLQIEDMINRIKIINSGINVFYVDPEPDIVDILKHADGYLNIKESSVALLNSRKKLLNIITIQRKRLEENGIL